MYRTISIVRSMAQIAREMRIMARIITSLRLEMRVHPGDLVSQTKAEKEVSHFHGFFFSGGVFSGLLWGF